MRFNFNDGGRSQYFKATKVGDCVTRAIAITSGRDYKEVYNLIRKTTGETPRNGVHTKTAKFKRLMATLGYEWTPTMTIGSGCTTHLREEELPKGRIICTCSSHWVAVIDGVVNDTYDCTRDESRCVYGYWKYIKK